MNREMSDRLARKHYSAEHLETMRALVEVRESPVHGLGCFARVAIPEAAEVGVMNGPAWLSDTYDPHVMFNINDDGQWVDPVEVVGPLRFSNHSAEPNLEIIDTVLAEPPYLGRQVGVAFALRDIAPGEELTWYYSDEFDIELREGNR